MTTADLIPCEEGCLSPTVHSSPCWGYDFGPGPVEPSPANCQSETCTIRHTVDTPCLEKPEPSLVAGELLSTADESTPYISISIGGYSPEDAIAILKGVFS